MGKYLGAYLSDHFLLFFQGIQREQWSIGAVENGYRNTGENGI